MAYETFAAGGGGTVDTNAILSFEATRNVATSNALAGATLAIQTNVYSTNGVLVNGTRVMNEKSLKNSDRIQVGNAVLETRS